MNVSIPMACRIVVSVAMLALAGCALDMHLISDQRDQVIRVRSGDRYYLTLEEGGKDGVRWSAKSDDPDVRVTVDHGDDEAKVRLWIRRGFDGPANVAFTCRQRSGTPHRGFTISFYKATIDRAFWE